MRKGCIDCVIKHLGEAAIFDEEFNQGYPEYFLYVVGCLSHASMEVREFSQWYADVIRDHRLKWMSDPTRYKIPYEKLAFSISAVIVNPENGTEAIAVNPDVLEGLDHDGDKFVRTADTRPE